MARPSAAYNQPHSFPPAFVGGGGPTPVASPRRAVYNRGNVGHDPRQYYGGDLRDAGDLRDGHPESFGPVPPPQGVTVQPIGATTGGGEAPVGGRSGGTPVSGTVGGRTVYAA